MATATLVMTNALSSQLAAAALLPVESAGVVLARIARDASTIRVLAREVHWVSDGNYARRESAALSIAAEGYIHALGRAETMRSIPIWFHTHPGLGSDPSPSSHDRVVDQQIAELFRLRSASKYYGALIVAPRGNGISFTGFLEDGDGCRSTFDRLWSVGERFRLTWHYGGQEDAISPEFDRNIRAFGPMVQRTLSALRIGIVGCGGTGSAVAEQITRLGARCVTLVDPDVLTDSNVTRVYGSRPDLVGQQKVDVLAEHLKSLAPNATVLTVPGAITARGVAEHLIDCDIVFGCTDDNGGRLVLSRLSSYFLTPVIDCGVLLTSDTGQQLTGINGRVTTLIPGHGCLVCRNRIDLARASTELLSAQERSQRIKEGYAPALGGIEPAVVTFTTAVASFAVTELLDRLIGFGPEPRPSELLLRGHEREISTNICLPRTGHYCSKDCGKIGLGLTEPLLEQAWPDLV